MGETAVTMINPSPWMAQFKPHIGMWYVVEQDMPRNASAQIFPIWDLEHRSSNRRLCAEEKRLAYLMAAAEDLYEAAQAVIRWRHEWGAEDEDEIFRNLDEAVMKATSIGSKS